MSTRSSLFIALLFAALAACNTSPDQATVLAAGNPAGGNLAPADQAATGTPAPAPTTTTDADYQAPVEAASPPPPLPIYTQPPCPGENYIWTPGYWAYSNTGYYWVPGVWVLAPWVGALWTPPWWGFDNGFYVWHAGYWGPYIGFYGGIDYGFGYTGLGYFGAYWNGGRVYYNRAVTNVDPRVVRNVYNYAVPHRSASRVSYNSGRGGIEARPTAREMSATREARRPAVPAQVQHEREAATNRGQFAGRSRPSALAASRPLATNYRAPAARPPAETMRTASPRTQARVESRPVQRPEARAAARPAPRPEARAQARPQARAQARPEARPQGRPMMAQNRNVPHPEARSHPAPAHPAPQAHPQPPHGSKTGPGRGEKRKP